MKTPWEQYKEKNKFIFEKYKEKNGVTPLDLLNPKTKPASKELAEQRFNICQNCEYLIPIINQCKKCGCFMKFKVGLEASKCPEKKW